MSRKKTLRVVIDASVARSSGSKNVPSSQFCREFLEEFRKSKNIILMSNKIFKEWNQHESAYAKKWRSKMIGSKRMIKIDDVEYDEIRKKLEEHHMHEKTKNEVRKDLHLVEAALETDKLVVSCDDKMRKNLISLACNCGCLRELIWTNPTNPYEEVTKWMQLGCEKDETRMIGYTAQIEAASS